MSDGNYRRQDSVGSVPKSLLGAKRPDTIENNLYVKNIGNRTSRAKAINAFCAHCMGCSADHMEPGYKQDIKHCQSNTCPLWYFRPYQEKSS